MRILIHAGFHKTGTTTMQKTLRANRKVLRPCRIVLRPDMVALCEAARAYSVSRSQTDLALIQYEAASLAESWGTETADVVLSSEDLSGHMPGRRGLTTYDATPRIMRALTQAIAAALPNAEQVLYFTTRAADPWLRSCYVQHLRATRITLSAAEYAARMAASADLDGIVAQVAAAVPGIRVVAQPLEGCTTPLGPLAPLLDVLGIAPETLNSRPPENTSPPPGLTDAMLALNRSDLSDADWRVARDALKREDF
ncbi:hypothetical protein [Pseudosulfitobacter koreensis]|uniref:Sulfotransferase family protein n=1 Tax=Pseudosulfitobacter koreensis TaxID=2968472 RepID=A0ABT1YVT2_9RHOB|nr:hypothetical protein [Pseudosulfitobacter koreense]MCR8824993.1 hypothetical protein [Pseudosulfitobacter koreense]